MFNLMSALRIFTFSFLFLSGFLVKSQWLAGYTYNKEIIINSSKVCGASSLTSFPMLVSFTDPQLATVANGGQVQNSNGYDIVFTASDGVTLLNEQIENYVATTGELEVWVQIPTLSNSVNTDIYMYFGNALVTTNPSSTGTWASSYVGVYHLTNSFTDATSNGYNATNSGSSSVTGEIAKASSFNGTSNYVIMPNSQSSFALTGTVTVELWFKATAAGVIFDELGQSAINTSWHDSWIEILASGQVDVRVWNLTPVSLGTVTFGTWHHAVLCYNAATTTLNGFLDGVPSATSFVGARTLPWNNSAGEYFCLGPQDGTNVGSGAYFNGVIDEVKISNIALSSSWICTEYNNQSNPSTFYTVQSEVTCTGSPVGGTASATNPTVNSGNFTNIILTAYTGSTFQWQTSPDGINFTNITGATSSVYTTPALTSNTWYRAIVTTGGTCMAYSTSAEVMVIPAFLACASYREMITINQSQVSGGANLTNFPVLINITSSNLATVSNGGHVQNANGYDIRFTASDGQTLLNFQLESYTATTGAVIAWVEIPTLSAISNTVIYMYYGDGTISTNQSSTNTWNSNYVGVWHLNGNYNDATSNGYNATNSGATSAAGNIGNGQSFNGSSSYIISPNTLSSFSTTTGTVTAEVWFKASAAGIILDEVGAASLSAGWHDSWIEVLASGQVQVRVWNLTGVSLGTVTFGTWHHAVICYNGSTNTLYGYLDGVQSVTSDVGTARSFPWNNGFNEFFCLGPSDATNLGSGAYFNGVMDELKISNSILSSGWIATEYNNVNSLSSFYTVGAESGSSAGGTATPLASPLFQGENTNIYLTNYSTSGTTLQWQSSPDNITFSNLTGETSSVGNSGTLNSTTYFRCAVTNGSCIAYSTIATVTVEPQFLSGYVFRKLITINSSEVSGGSNLTNFPVLVSFTDPNLATITNGGNVNNANGYDINFTQSDGQTTLNYQIETYVAASGQLVAWVRIPTLSATTTTSFYMYYGNCTVNSSQGSANTWNTNYVGVWHLSSNFNDVTSNANNATNSGTTNVAGNISNGQSFNGTSNYIVMPNTSSSFTSVNGTVTAELWFKANAAGVILDELGTAAINTSWHDSWIEVLATGQVKVRVWNLTALSLGTVSFGTWHHAVISYNSVTSTLDGFLDGVQSLTSDVGTARSLPWNSGDGEFFCLGPTDVTNQGSGAYFSGVMDEVKISNVALSAGWIATEYNNQNNPSSFYSVGSQQGQIGWAGTVSTVWGNASNWTSCAVPSSGSNIYIPGGLTNYPVLDMNRTVGYLWLANGSSATISGYNLTMTGDLAVDGTLTATSGTVTLNGSSLQTIKGSNPINLNNLVVNNSTAYNAVLVSENTTINGNLTLTDGHVVTAVETPLTMGPGATVTLNSSTVSLPQDSSFIRGTLPCTTLSTAASETFVFPLGSKNKLHEINLNLTHTAGSSVTYTGSYVLSPAYNLNYTLPSTVDTVSRTDYWDIVQSSSVSQTVTAASTVLYYIPMDGVTDYTNLTVVKGDTSVWTDIGGVATANGTGLITSGNFTHFSLFAFGNKKGGHNPLPIELLSFTASPDFSDKQVNLNWVTATETNNNFFTVERSSEGLNFNSVCLVKGAGNSSAVLNYSAVDAKPLAGLSYYRLKQTDFDGKFAYSQVVPVNFSGLENVEYFLFPNPMTAGQGSQLKINSSENKTVLVVVRDISGKEIFANLVIVQKDINSFVAIDPEQKLSPGLYLIVATSDNSVYNQKLIVK